LPTFPTCGPACVFMEALLRPVSHTSARRVDQDNFLFARYSGVIAKPNLSSWLLWHSHLHP
jgi:hypothetical protein